MIIISNYQFFSQSNICFVCVNDTFQRDSKTYVFIDCYLSSKYFEKSDVLSAEKTRPHLPDYVIYVPSSYWKLFLLLIDHARTSHLTDFESFIDSQCHLL